MRQERQDRPVRRLPQAGQASNPASVDGDDICASCRIAAPVVEAPDADYSSCMSQEPATQVFRLEERRGPAGRVVFRQQTADRARLLVVASYDGPELPAAVTDPTIESIDGAAGRYRLASSEGAFEFRARSVERLEERPSLYAPLHRPFALSSTDRFAVRVLLLLLRLPGGARLLRLWHRRRSG